MRGAVRDVSGVLAAWDLLEVQGDGELAVADIGCGGKKQLAELHRVLKPTGVLHVLCPHWRHVNAAADPTHVRTIDPLTLRWFCDPTRPDVSPWRPLCVTETADTVHADLQPLVTGRADSAELARWFA